MTDEQRRLAEESRRRTFLALNRYPDMWADAACRHMRAADFLYDIGFRGANRTFEHRSGSREIEGQEAQDWYDAEMLTEYMLLAGLATECLLKACCVVLKPELVKDTKITGELGNHNQAKLAALCELDLTQDESAILTCLTDQIRDGKYPGPMKAEDIPFYSARSLQPIPRPCEVGCALWSHLGSSRRPTGPKVVEGI